ncbi:PREDICTED: zinc finger protein basonuclin-2-like [Poecilia mexicana]|uniref:zinc finger protein basonuclin-2-like n=1 Tax=Poecilia mexicana TaxID=48701 RepID=UPI00072DA792|nr:PREDICTED: zinc finger protein basonuclin-2-like [Poecilia mexicana]
MQHLTEGGQKPDLCVRQSVRCSVSSCSCACFKPGKVKLRSCDRCGHGWVEHALETVQAAPPSGAGPVEVALPGLVFDLSSLVLFGAQAVPVQLKILLDRLYSVLTPEQVGQILNGLGWSLGDYVRGYMLQRPDGEALERWDTATAPEQLLLLRQFLRFGETRPIVEEMILQHLEGEALLPHQQPDAPLNDWRIGSLRDARPADSSAASGNVPGGQSVLLPFHFPQSAVFSSAKEAFPSPEPQTVLQDFRKNKLVQKHDRHRCGEDHGSVRQRSEPASSMKTDPDKSNPSLWQQNPILHHDRVFLQKRLIQEKTASFSSSFNFSLPPSSLMCSPVPSSSSSSSSSRLPQTLPSFSSSFLRPLHSFSSPLLPVTSPCSSLHPLPSSLCSFPSLLAAGGRKGRVSCGVCGKSFYDKGTLKIHYNAVHLKIKHRCTVLGCSMVFSSLRSRNRHSANPNPRLHTAGSRDAQPYRNTLCGQSSAHAPTQRHREKQETQGSRNDDSSHNAPREAASPTPPLVPPAPPSGAFLPSGAFPSSLTDLQTGQQWWQKNQSLPQKKKPRKSSMPLKIEREKTQSSKHEGES